MDLDRRGFLRTASTIYLTAALPFASGALRAQAEGPVRFPQGVASADPQPDAVLLWTRAESGNADDIELVVQLSTGEDFSSLLLEQPVTALAKEDHTVRVRVGGLEPGRQYFYRFLASEGGMSRTGRSLTAPSPDSAEPLNLAFVSCQNYEQGFYGAWARMLHEDRQRQPGQQIDMVLHLGDFIYERYSATADWGQRRVRELPAFPDGGREGEYVWADSLADYRHLYRTHLEDPWLQAARARWPFVYTWDDHEFSNDSIRHYSFYGDEPLAEPERQRRAHQAWYEYIPAQVEPLPDEPDRAGSGLNIHRRLQWGKLVDLWMTDLRSFRSGPTLPHGLREELGLPVDPIELVDIFDGGRAYNGGQPPETLPFGDGTIPNAAREREPGSLMGAEQRDWFKAGLADSNATWKIWGNSLPILPFRMDLGSIPLAGMHDSVLGTDAWNGYPGEYRELMGWLQSQDISGLVSLSGDHHMQAAATLVTDPDIEGSPSVAVDFNVTGISSTPHFDNVMHSAQKDNSGFMQLVASEGEDGLKETWNMTLYQGVLASLAYDKTGLGTLANWLGPNPRNPGLRYIDTNSNGYGLASFTAEQCEVELVTIVAPLADAGPEGSQVQHRARFTLPSWKAGEDIALSGPDFSGTPPFPWSEQ